MKTIDKIRKMTPKELADILHYDLGSSTCPDCILNNLNKMQYCKSKKCIENIKSFLESEETNEEVTYEEIGPD